MAQNSFDIESNVDLQEVDNGINQARKEIANRFDFKGSNSRVEFDRDEKTIQYESSDDYKVRSIKDILLLRLSKRGVSPKSLTFEEPETTPTSRVKQLAKIEQGINHEKGREIQDFIKGLKFKVQIQIQEDKMRVTGRSRNDLQDIINSLKNKDLGIPLTFTNFR